MSKIEPADTASVDKNIVGTYAMEVNRFPRPRETSGCWAGLATCTRAEQTGSGIRVPCGSPGAWP